MQLSNHPEKYVQDQIVGWGGQIFSKETELGSSDQEASPSAGKNTRAVLVPCSSMEVRPYSYFRWCGYF